MRLALSYLKRERVSAERWCTRRAVTVGVLAPVLAGLDPAIGYPQPIANDAIPISNHPMKMTGVGSLRAVTSTARAVGKTRLHLSLLLKVGKLRFGIERIAHGLSSRSHLHCTPKLRH
jgi:hypothetical protein